MSQIKKKCLFVLPDLSGGGAEKVTLTLLRHLDRDQFSPTLFLFKAQGDFLTEVPKDVPLLIALDGSHSTWWDTPKILNALFRAAKNYDVVIGSLELKGILFATIAAFLAKVPSIAWVHKHLGVYFKQHKWWHRVAYWLATALVFSLARKVITVSQEAAQSLRVLFPWCQPKIAYHYNPIDYEQIDKVIALDNMSYQVKTLLAVGRLTSQKGFDVLLQAMALVVEKLPHTQLLILGEGEQRSQLTQLIQVLMLDKHVSLAGFHSPYYAMAHTPIFVMSSRYEGLPTVMLEAMYCGAAIISTKCPSGPTEILADGKYGVLVDVDNPQQLAQAIIELLNEPEYLAHLKIVAKQRANDFALEKICQTWQQDLIQISKS